jgi:[acyl-carrier-protein] S-malonyltransferase
MADLAVLCPGQGTQTETMFDIALESAGGAGVLAAFAEAGAADLVGRVRAGDRLFENAFAQPAMVAAALALWTTLSERLPAPALFAGYSVGEVSAWACAGGWSAVDAARVAAARADAMDRFSPPACGMLAVRGLPADEGAGWVDGLDVAIVNEADHVVLAGPVALFDEAERLLGGRGAWTRRLDVHVPSHTPSMTRASEAFAAALRDLRCRDVAARVLGGVDGVGRKRGVEATDLLARAVRETLRWDACMAAIRESGVRVALELGPGRSLANLCQANCPEVSVRSIADFRTVDGIVNWVVRELDT